MSKRLSRTGPGDKKNITNKIRCGLSRADLFFLDANGLKLTGLSTLYLKFRLNIQLLILQLVSFFENVQFVRLRDARLCQERYGSQANCTLACDHGHGVYTRYSNIR